MKLYKDDDKRYFYMDITPAQEVNEVEDLAGQLAPLKEILVFAIVPAFTPLNCPRSQQSLSLVQAKYVNSTARLTRGWGWDLPNYIPHHQNCSSEGLCHLVP